MRERLDRNGEAFAEIEDALRTYPLAPAPPSLSPAVMARIRALRPASQFRLTWLDYAATLFSAAMLGVGFFVWQFLTPEFWPQLQYELPFLVQNLNLEVWASVFMGGVALAAVFLALAGLILGQPGGLARQRVRYGRERG